MALGNPGKVVGMMWDEKAKRWVWVEAAAGVDSGSALPMLGLIGVVGVCIWLWNRP